MAKLAEIPQISRDGRYACDVPWSHLEEWVSDHAGRSGGIDLDPVFQRGDVWTDAQRSAFIEFILQGGKSSQVIYWNAPNWMGTRNRPGQDLPSTLVLVDGKQRLETVRRFMRNELPAFGLSLHQWEDSQIITRGGPTIRMSVNDLVTRKAVLDWYLGLNAGGTPHPPSEIHRVASLRDAA